METKKTIKILKELKTALKTALKENNVVGLYMCNILNNMGYSCDILKSSGLEALWLSREGNSIDGAWHVETTPLGSYYDYCEAFTREKIECLNIIIKRLEKQL